MEDSSFPSMGATLFFGLIAVALITHAPPDPDYANPSETMAGAQFETAPQSLAPGPDVSWLRPVAFGDLDLAALRDTGLDAGATSRQALAIRTDVLPQFGPQIRVTQNATALAGSTDALVLPRTDDHTAIFSPAAPALVRKGRPVEAQAAPRGHPLDPGATTSPVLRTRALVTDLALEPSDTRQAWRPNRHSQFIAPLFPEFLPQGQAKVRLAEVTGDRVFLRELPDLGANPVAQFDSSTPVRILETRGNWRRVEIADLIGWMFADFLRETDLQ